MASWAEYRRPGTVLPDTGRRDGYRVAHFDVPAGEQTYAIVDDGAWQPDPNVPTTAFHDGREVTWLTAPDCGAPAVRVDTVTATPEGTGVVDATFLATTAGDGLDPASIAVTGRDGQAISFDANGTRAGDGHVHLALRGLAPGKHSFTLSVRDTAGRKAPAVNASAWVEPRPFDLRDAVIYHVMVDRYRGDAGSLAAPDPPSARAGGTMRGLTRALEAGDITRLGANTVWLSPLYANPDGEFPGSDGRGYSSYHGYWPIAPRATDARIAPEADVDAFVAAAHNRGVRVLFDVVPNHVHEQHPYWRDARASHWFNEAKPTCVCGQGSCDWATHTQTCWFAPYMPDLDWTNDDVARQVSSDVAWWMGRFDGDGVRIDAVPMMPRAATRRIVSAIRTQYAHPGNPMMLLGENFTGPGGYNLLKYQLGPFGLDSQFHFPLMWALRSAVAGEATSGMRDVQEAVVAGEAAWRDSGAVMATMIGNHDVTRFASESAGDASGDGWVPAPQPLDTRVYAKQRLALGVIFTLPGAPVVYYGDEVALAGRVDPDSRRVMPAESALSDAQRATRAYVEQLGKARACIGALRRGTFRPLFADAETMAFAREGDGLETAVVVASRDPSVRISAVFPGVPDGAYVDALTGGQATLMSELTILDPAPFSVRIYVPRASACARATPSPP